MMHGFPIARIGSKLGFLILSALTPSAVWSQAADAPPGTPPPQGQNAKGVHVFIWSGLKSHREGQHDYPQFLADWSKYLTGRGAVVDGALHVPTSSDLAHTNVLVIYKGDAGFLSDTQKGALEDFVKRGGGIISLHDSLCGPDPAYFATLVGGAKKHGEVNYTLEAPVHYTIADKASPLMKDFPELTVQDEAFFSLTWAKNGTVHVLANAEIAPTPSAGTHKGEVVPQIWTYEHTVPGGQPARAFVWMQGHNYSNFANEQVRKMLLRAIAWAGNRPIDELVNYVAPPPRPRPGATPPAAQP